jgi:adenylate kinase family enzyme
LIGPPGTGKTTFIRGLLAHRSCSAIVTYDAGILEKDGFFAIKYGKLNTIGLLVPANNIINSLIKRKIKSLKKECNSYNPLLSDIIRWISNHELKIFK